MGDIGHRIFGLRLGQRAARPIGEARSFIQIGLGDLFDQRLVAHLFAKAADHGGNLGVKQGHGKAIAFDKENFQILAGSVKDFHSRLVAKQIIDRFQRHIPALNRVDQDRFAILARQRHLDQAELGPKGPLAQKLCINRDIGMGFGGSAEGGEICGRGDGAHGQAFTRGLRVHPA